MDVWEHAIPYVLGKIKKMERCVIIVDASEISKLVYVYREILSQAQNK
jgi:hypothetical protein